MSDKGWSQEEISHARAVWLKHEKGKSLKQRVLDKTIFWFLVFFAILINAFAAIMVTPLFLVLPAPHILLAIALLALGFGSMFAVLLRDVDHHHNLFLGIICVVSLVAFGLVFKEANGIQIRLGNAARDSFFFAVAYVVFFILPYIFIKPRRFSSWT
jgi:hypothetical protein